MPFLIGKDYVAPIVSKKDLTSAKKTSLKTLIKTACPKDKKKSYEDVIAYVRKNDAGYYTNDEIVALIDDLKKKDADYKLPEPVVEDIT